MKRLLVAKISRARCNHKIMFELVDKLTEKEAEAVYRLLQNTELEAKREGQREVARKPWKLFR